MSEAAVVLAAAPRPVPAPLTIGEALDRIAPGLGWDGLWDWPPDVFAATSVLLADSGAYRFVVCPPSGESWPPRDVGRWQDAVRRCAEGWAAGPGVQPSEALRDRAAVVRRSSDLPLEELEDESRWEIVTAILTLHAAADEASAGAGLRSETRLQRLAADLLAGHGSLARLGHDRVRVLPKLRPPESGITLRSLSHHLAIDRSEVETRWYVAAPARDGESVRGDKLTLLLVPYPATIHSGDFHPVQGPLLNMDEGNYGFYDFAPTEPFEAGEIVELVATARRHVGSVDAVVLPEAAIEPAEVAPLQDALHGAGVPLLLTGVREPPSGSAAFGRNYAYLGGPGWQAAEQQKHHRWCLDSGQVHQYHLGAALDPRRRWWEAIGVHKRTLTFATVSDWLTICPLVCEDLARPDPVADVIRAVGPTLVVGLLLDGPQLAARWPARYASVLADDPGCSVLTLTALGMAERSQPPGCPRSRVIALWKDPHRGLQEIPLAEGARAVAATAHVRAAATSTADGRAGTAPELVLSGLEQIR